MYKGVIYLLKFAWKEEKRYIIYQFLLQILTALVPLADTIIPKYIIDELTNEGNLQTVFYWIASLLIINLLGYLGINFFSGHMMILKGSLFTKFQTLMAEQLAQSDFGRLEDPRFLDIQAKAQRFLYANGQGFGIVLDNAFQILGKLFTFIGIVIIIITLNFWVVLGFIGLILLNTWFESRVRKQYVEWDLKKAPVERKTAYFLDLIGNFTFGKEIRIYGLKNWIVGKVHEHLLDSERFYRLQSNLMNKTQYVSTIMNFILKSVAYVYLAICVINKSVGIGDFTMYITALMSFSGAMTALMESLLNIRQFGGYYDALKEYMDVPQKMYAGKRLSVSDDFHEIRFENVSFCYPGQEVLALKNINLVLKRGEKLSVVGENGAGKTTFVKLLCRLYDPTQGRITIDGVDIRDIDYDRYMNLIGSVFQDYKLLSFTFKENVAFERAEDESDCDVYELLVRSGLEDRINTLQKGIHTHIYRNFDEDGIELSGGEGQKVALARALYKDAPIMILDEPTAALDPRAEYDIYQNFSKMTEGKTTVFISHRMSSSRFCDHIVLFSNGEISEYGSHEELMELNGQYRELFDMQAQYYIEDSDT